MTWLEDTVSSIAKAIGGLFDPKTYTKVFDTFDTVFDAIHLKVDAILSSIPSVEDIGNTFQDGVIDPVIDGVVQPILDALSEYVVEPLTESFQTFIVEPIQTGINDIVNQIREMF